MDIKSSNKIKFILISLIIFSVLILLPSFISSMGTYAYSYKTIVGGTRSSSDTYSHLLNAFDNKANSYSNFPSLNSNGLSGLDGITLHTQIDATDDETKYCHVFNRAGGKDFGREYKTTAFCYHATTSCSHKDNLRRIRGIAIIQDGKIDYLWTQNFNKTSDKYFRTTSSVDSGNNTYLQAMLANLYASQTNYDVAWWCANYYMYTDRTCMGSKSC